MTNLPNDYKQINGWGIEIDKENDPTYPMKNRTDAEQTGYSWERPTQQPEEMEVLHSIERPNLSAVYGTSVPLDGLSGMIRRFAFNYSENSYGHWLPLLLADRVNMIEGIIEDLGDGHLPNILAEKGYKAEWQHNRPALLTKAAVGVLVASAFIGMISSRNTTRRRRQIR